MLFVERVETDPYFNLAAEEYIFHHFEEEVVMLWRNTPAVVIGKHQNPYVEVNIPFVRENNIPIIRRISGGGSVYHDLGNLNFTWIQFAKNEERVNYRASLQPWIAILNRLSVPCEFAGKSNLMINNQKISGSAKHIFKNKVLHHGTLLYSSNLEHLNKAFAIHNHKITDKSIRSIPSPVTNISQFLTEPLSIEVFQDRLAREIKKDFSLITAAGLRGKDVESIEELAENKYRTWEWNFGYSPSYQLQTEIIYRQKPIKIEISVKRGLVVEISIFDTRNTPKLTDLFTRMTGLKHEEDSIRHFLNANPDLLADLGMSTGDMIRMIF